MKWYAVPDLKPSAEPFIKKVKVGGKSMCIVNYEGKLYAVGATCPHAGAELSGGWCKEGKIICPFHRYSYDLKTGKGSPGQNDFIDSYPIELRDGEIFVGIESFWDKVFGQ
ncbi:Rieske (2Fe-2S) protein [Mucilaginibacter sp.]|uniref:Rieske (2Fe-2S) protein n=1 Tax=Mucilaginibacter sp. TaxID=1882438 RepID=UPI000CAFF341|nr:Rieske 2Fe-2S domain-containing protein [Mucilaginibacter sp.]PLW91155.1 MAG: (2Fe-2S)-binding protein [Mucilaginibacter sp.]HEK21584.1 Rieske (2Fe-2S) protein [Bacteroidota bacterium]